MKNLKFELPAKKIKEVKNPVNWKQIERDFCKWDGKNNFSSSQRDILNWFKLKLKDYIKQEREECTPNEAVICKKPEHVICCLKSNELCTENISDCEFRESIEQQNVELIITL